MGVSNGNLILNNGGQVLTTGDFPGALDMTMVFSFTGNPYDSFRIALRTDGIVTGNRDLVDDGVWFSFRYETDPSDPTGFKDNVSIVTGNLAGSTLLAIGTIPIEMNQPNLIRIVDTGSFVSLYINDLSSPFLTAATTADYGDKIAFTNREGAGNGSYISEGSQVSVDFFSVTAVPDYGATAWYLGLSLPLLAFFARRMRLGCC